MADYLILDSSTDEAWAIRAASPGSAVEALDVHEDGPEGTLSGDNCSFVIEFEGNLPTVQRADGEVIEVKDLRQ